MAPIVLPAFGLAGVVLGVAGWTSSWWIGTAFDKVSKSLESRGYTLSCGSIEGGVFWGQNLTLKHLEVDTGPRFRLSCEELTVRTMLLRLSAGFMPFTDLSLKGARIHLQLPNTDRQQQRESQDPEPDRHLQKYEQQEQQQQQQQRQQHDMQQQQQHVVHHHGQQQQRHRAHEQASSSSSSSSSLASWLPSSETTRTTQEIVTNWRDWKLFLHSLRVQDMTVSLTCDDHPDTRGLNVQIDELVEENTHLYFESVSVLSVRLLFAARARGSIDGHPFSIRNTWIDTTTRTPPTPTLLQDQQKHSPSSPSSASSASSSSSSSPLPPPHPYLERDVSLSVPLAFLQFVDVLPGPLGVLNGGLLSAGFYRRRPAGMWDVVRTTTTVAISPISTDATTNPFVSPVVATRGDHHDKSTRMHTSSPQLSLRPDRLHRSPAVNERLSRLRGWNGISSSFSVDFNLSEAAAQATGGVGADIACDSVGGDDDGTLTNNVDSPSSTSVPTTTPTNCAPLSAPTLKFDANREAALLLDSIDALVQDYM
eukprot:TRINITY_DN1011_c0_g2_i1.p1 TRINITY_DN1011_c0_g2~~TRINITY_DN1011_c0_g2_i1.p1  ORF type:complete len:536 (+),score=151.58 TRINITY_DN1011_c0_g2_i1:244-1851(+)